MKNPSNDHCKIYLAGIVSFVTMLVVFYLTWSVMGAKAETLNLVPFSTPGPGQCTGMDKFASWMGHLAPLGKVRPVAEDKREMAIAMYHSVPPQTNEHWTMAWLAELVDGKGGMIIVGNGDQACSFAQFDRPTMRSITKRLEGIDA